MNYLSDSVSGFIEKLGKTFFLVGYVPALAFTVINYIVFFPAGLKIHPNINITTNPNTNLFNNTTLLLSIIGALIIPIVIGILLMALNTSIIRLYEGRIWILHKTIFWPLQRYNVTRCKQRYGEIVALKAEMRQRLKLLENANEPSEQLKFQQQIDSIAMQIEQEFEKLEKVEPQPSLPFHPKHVTPTALGNVFAIMEEYPFDRYGIDAVLLWTRLRPLLDDAAPKQVERLTNQKTLLDMLLNMSLLAGLTGIEAAISLLFLKNNNLLLWITTLIGLLLFWMFYQSAVSTAWSFGHTVTSCFDYYRELVLKQFNIIKPASLLEEQTIWLKLAAFLRRGEAYYWPQVHQTEIESPHLRQERR